MKESSNVFLLKINNILKFIKTKLLSLTKEQIILVLIGIILTVFSFINNNKSIFYDTNTILRDSYGGIDKTYNLYVDGITNKPKEIKIKVSNKKYTKEQADELFEELYDRIFETALGENNNYDNITTNLNLISKFKKEGVEVNWEFEPHNKYGHDNAEYFRKYQNIINKDGKVNNYDLLQNDIIYGYLKFKFVAYINNDKERYESKKYIIDVQIKNRAIPTDESNIIELNKIINTINANSKDEDAIVLPSKINGINIQYKEKKDFSCIIILILFVFAAFLISYLKKKKEQNIESERNKSLIMDYSNIVSKLLIFLGCGMTCRNAFIKIADNYEKNVQLGIQHKSIAYESVKDIKKMIMSGIPEIKAYAEFAKQVNNKLYSRFISIIEQNIKNGSKTLIESLQIEVTDAFEERKQNAIKLGEEASTKLIIPLMMMLGIVMVIVMVPALMTF